MSRRQRLLLGVASLPVALFVAAYALLASSAPTPEALADLDLRSDFTADRAGSVRTLDDYLALEEALFDELDAAVAGRSEGLRRVSRYHPDSPTNPRALPRDWNRTFRWPVDPPRAGGAVLLHGLTDSPYSLRAVAELLAEARFEVLGLRLPGHGTIPAGIRRSTVDDWRAAVAIAARQIGGRGTDEPFVVVGYSVGAALALDYALTALDDPGLRVPDRLVLLSPALAAPRIAGVAVWQSRLSRLPGLAHLAWSESLPEVDPFKYNSFPVFAGDQYYRLTLRVEDGLARLEEADRLGELPPVLVIQSVVDATVQPRPSLGRLLPRLDERSELVLFDANRLAVIEELLDPRVDDVIEWLASEPALRSPYTLVTNAGTDRAEVRAITRRPGSSAEAAEGLGLAWPAGIYSLSHVAIPIPPEDPVYGTDTSLGPPFPFGLLELRGERELLQIPHSLISRMRYNPFFPYVERRILEFVGGTPSAERVDDR